MGITCQEIVELVTAYLEDAMTTEQRDEFERHLAVCPGCADYVEQFRVTIEELGKVQVESLPPETQQSLLDAFRTWP